MPEIWPIYMSAEMGPLPFRHRSEGDILLQKMHPSGNKSRTR